jgi:hypothetical protein
MTNNLKDRLLNFLSAPDLDGLKISYSNLASLSVEDNVYIVEYESYFNPHAAPKQLKDVKKFSSLIDAINFFVAYLEENKS